MKRSSILAACAAAILLALAAVAQQPKTPAPRFEPVQVVSAVDAVYPMNSIAMGTVVLQVTVETDGSISSVKVVRDIKSLTIEAERAVRRWKFAPATLDGAPVRGTIAVAFTFRLVTTS